ncbi:hypothetical protein BOTBODRAFT_285503 [Botryobasidium botryosum FD-172 SS1]|uniref:DNA polymerase epsilon subunit D n=1 Tax=Botryobasidium botryosum (strain FD-172 SS1) TaxID=930990 RepID=A0A067MLT6_BOTB1|nr:hypothetical protein BOTBODRAFT_285503 [Botryobasidium botryosum FD-172 SS1]
MPRKESTVGVSSAQAQQDAILETEGIESYELPRALIIRIAKSVLQDNVKLQKETVIALVKAATVFINYVAATSQDVTHSRSHKTIAASDVLTALSQLGFKAMVPQLNEELARMHSLFLPFSAYFSLFNSNSPFRISCHRQECKIWQRAGPGRPDSSSCSLVVLL